MVLDRKKVDIAMAKKCMTIADLAQVYGASAQRMRRIFSSRKVQPATVGKIAQALGVDVTEIIE